MAILEERGLFWWADEVVPETQFAPDSCIAGLLVISDDGQTRLELDGYFPGQHGPMTPLMRQTLPIDRDIRGVLKTSNKHVLLTMLRGNGGHVSTNGMSYERYLAGQCLVADGFTKPPTTHAFKEIIIPLVGFEEWLWLAGIKAKSSKRMISVKYKQQKDVVYSTTDGKMSFHFGIEHETSGTVVGVAHSLKETASTTFRFRKLHELKDVILRYRMFEDLLLVLTGSDCTLDWPWVVADKTRQCRLYFQKIVESSSQKSPKSYECITNFVNLREKFGDIWSAWEKKREEFGPGFFLYLGTRRNVSIYIENRFVNLVFGLEAFHRRKYLASPSPNIEAKIERIVAQVSLAKDRKWLKGILNRADDQLPLWQRLYETLREVPLDLDETRLKNFCNACGKLRNNFSHFGGLRDNKIPYNDFILDLDSKARALATLYHALLLYEIGIEHQIIKAWVFDSFSSFPIKYNLVRVGLLDKDVLLPSSNAGVGRNTMQLPK